MNIGEFKKMLEDRDIPDNYELRIDHRGGMRGPGTSVKCAGPGIDWDGNAVLIVPTHDLTFYEWYRDIKKIADADATHIAHALKEAEKVVDASDGYGDPGGPLDEAVGRLGTALERLKSFQKQGF